MPTQQQAFAERQGELSIAFHRANAEWRKFSPDKSLVSYPEACANLEAAMRDLLAIWHKHTDKSGHLTLSAVDTSNLDPATAAATRRMFASGGAHDAAVQMTATPAHERALTMDQICDAVSGLDAVTTDSVLRMYGVSRGAYDAHVPVWKARIPERARAWLSAAPATPPGDGLNEATQEMQRKMMETASTR
jgi:hypothetical protein